MISKCMTTMNIQKLNACDAYLMDDHIVELTLDSILHEALVTIHLVKENGNLEILNIQKQRMDVKIVCETICDEVKKHMLWRQMGIRFDKCEKRFVIMYKNKIAGSIMINYLDQTFEPTTKRSFSWVVKSIHSKNTIDNVPITYLNMMDALCIPHSDIMNSMELEEVMAEYF